MMGIKAYQIRNAVIWLRRFHEKRKNKRSYVNPEIYTEERCIEIIDACTDAELHAAGIIDIHGIRELVEEMRKQGGKDD